VLEKLLKIFPLIKVDDQQHMVWGCVTSETPDSDKEICDYAEAKSEIKKWSDDQLAKTIAAGQDPSLGNMRVMHQLQIGGKAIKIEYRDDQKQVWVGSEPASDDVWHLLKGGFLTGHSIGGSYKWKKPEGEYVRYAPTIGEISYVDRQANPDAAFSYVKADGTTELRKFQQPGPAEKEMLRKMRLGSLADLSQDDIDRLAKAVAESLTGADSDLDTRLKKISAQLAEMVGQLSAADGGNTMNPEQIKKCAAALGISEEDFKKQFALASDLDKAKKGIAALHGHIEGAMSHHAEMHKAHSAMAAMHEKHSAHLEKCMKACKAVMGADDGEADKAINALLADLLKTAGETPEQKVAREAAEKAAAAAAASGTMTKAEVDALVTAAIAKAIGELPKPDPGGLRIVPRTGEPAKKAEQVNADPIPV
jgi:hypothetical protein